MVMQHRRVNYYTVCVVSGNVLIFIVFGAVLMASGAGDLLMKIANIATGRFTGGAAHAAVASSALFGTLSGAAISNVVSTGVMTIPVIKKSGFKPAFAAAVEAAASTGGQVMPPVMFSEKRAIIFGVIINRQK